jgi:hypothetical protein
MTKPILYDLGVALGSISLWLSPWDITRAAGYSISILFSGRAYYTGLVTLQEERKSEEKSAIAYEADVDFTDQLLGTQVDSQLEIKLLEIENKKLQALIPLVSQNQALHNQLQSINPVHPELSEDDKYQAVKQAIDNTFSEAQEIDEETIRKTFPESMDSTSWKAILKSLQAGSTRLEIIRDVLGCSDGSKAVGDAYYEFLKRKFGV